jgi:hypothetical protein
MAILWGEECGRIRRAREKGAVERRGRGPERRGRPRWPEIGFEEEEIQNSSGRAVLGVGESVLCRGRARGGVCPCVYVCPCVSPCACVSSCTCGRGGLRSGAPLPLSLFPPGGGSKFAAGAEVVGGRTNNLCRAWPPAGTAPGPLDSSRGAVSTDHGLMWI